MLKDEKIKKIKKVKRIKRILIVGIAFLLTFLLGNFLAKSKSESEEILSSFTLPMKRKLENFGERILGKAIQILPDVSNIEENNQGDELEENIEPVEKPIKDIEKQTDSLLQMIKELPRNQLEAIRAQIHKEICK